MKIQSSSVRFGLAYGALIVIVGVGFDDDLPWWAWGICAGVGGFLAGFFEAALSDLVKHVRSRR